MMKEVKYLKIDDYEQRVIVNALNQMRTNLINEEMETDPVDEILLKVIAAPSKKDKGKLNYEYSFR